MITEQDLKDLRAKLDEYQEEVRGSDEILSGLIAFLIRQIDEDMTALWFYGSALKSRRERNERLSKTKA